MIRDIFTARKKRGRKPVKRGGVFGTRKTPFVARNWQLEAYERRNDQYLIVDAPGGSGKSMLVIFMAIWALARNPKLKLIISVPKRVIEKTFRQTFVQLPDGSQWEWGIVYQLCGDVTESKVSRIIKFVKDEAKTSDIKERVLICTHAALAKAHKKMVAGRGYKKAAQLFANTLLAIDEGHHVLAADSSDVSNYLGKLVTGIIDFGGSTARIWIITATYFRGDSFQILPDGYYDVFERYRLPLDRHWDENIEYIESYAFSYVIYRNRQVLDDAKRLLTRNRGKTIIYCPRMGHYLLQGTSKAAFMKRLISMLDDLGLKSLDLVQFEGRSEAQEKFLCKKTMEDYDVVLAVEVLNEGADWEQAVQVIDLAPAKTSLVKSVQRWLRLLRDIPGKKHIHYYMCLPFSPVDVVDPEERRRNCSELFTAVIAAATLSELIQPVEAIEVKDRDGKKQERRNCFEDNVPDIGDRDSVLDDSLKALTVLKAQKEADDEIVSPADALACLSKVLREHGVTKDIKKITRQIFAMLCRVCALPKAGIDVSHIVNAGFDKVSIDTFYEGFASFGFLKGGTKTFQELREAWESLTLAEAYPDLAAEWHPTKNGDLTPDDVTVRSMMNGRS